MEEGAATLFYGRARVEQKLCPFSNVKLQAPDQRGQH